MCGIFALFSANNLTSTDIEYFGGYAEKCKHRGPDMTKHQKISDRVFFVFHRLCVNDKTPNGMQPFNIDGSYSICNGEIYNHKELRQKIPFDSKSSSDCEIIIPTLQMYDPIDACSMFDGVFSFVVYDSTKKEVTVGRDPFGVRSLYIGTKNGNIIFASEMKCIPSGYDVKQYSPGCCSQYALNTQNYWSEKNTLRYYDYCYKVTNFSSQSDVIQKIRLLLKDAVDKRMMSDRPIGCLLSGGLDSSIVVAILADKYKKIGKKLRTFSVGLKGSVDLKYARDLANFIGTDHTELILSEDEMFNKLEEDIYMIESYDTTTVRASTPMYLLCRYIKENTDIAVIFSGEGSDEASGSYLYFHNAPDDTSFKKETERLLKDLHHFDVLRCDKSSACAGLEIRVPFLDKDFIEFYMSIGPDKKKPKYIEKELLRLAFNHMLPEEITWRRKEGMSDGVSCKSRSWYSIIQEKINSSIHLSNSDIEVYRQHNPPLFDESLYYRNVFHKYYPERDTIIPYYWLPKWCGNIKDPSARILKIYN